MYSRYGQNSPYGNYVPPPHLVQAHFHPGGLPDLDSLIPNGIQDGGLIPGEKGYYCGFDTLSTSGHPPSVSAENILIVGFEGGVCVYRVNGKHVDLIGKLEGLKGGVVGAKILPWTNRRDLCAKARPCIALILHGPIIESSDALNSSDSSATASSEDHDSPAPSTRPPSSKGPPNQSEIFKKYQTTVEVYSLLTRERIATLFTSTAAEVTYSQTGDFKIPPPIGDLTLAASGTYVLVASGVSGEILVFTPFSAHSRSATRLENFRCVGKLWTSIQRRDLGGEDEPSSPTEEAPSRGNPIFSLSQRWLAVVPPPTSAAFTINGTPKLSSSNLRPPGLTNVVPPAPPTTNVSVDTPGSSNVMGRLSREVTQGALKAAKWMGQQSMQAWNNYWNQQTPYHGVNGALLQPDAQNFPPTHGHTVTPTNTRSETFPQVAIYDLQRMLDAEEKKTKNALMPLGSFDAPSGCSFLSFAPNGLQLLTVSLKGDEHYVWNLMHLYKAGNYMSKDIPGQYVRQVWKFVRTTVATVIDVTWSSPHGNRFAMMTARGTIHVHEIPASAFQWPLFHRARRVKEAPRDGSSDENKEPLSPDSRWNSTIKTINGTASWLKSVRSKSVSAGTSIRDLTMTPAVTAAVGSKVVKTGLSKGLGALANSAGAIYHAGDNKLYIRDLPDGSKPGLMRFMTGRDHGSLAVVVGPIIRICPVRQTSMAQRGRAPVIRAKVSKRGKEFRLPSIPDDMFPPAVAQTIRTRYSESPEPNGNVARFAEKTTGYWALRSPRGFGQYHPPRNVADNWHAKMEAETNPPYMPFHSDRRTALFIYSEPEAAPPATPDPEAPQHELDDYSHSLAEWTARTLDTFVRTEHHFDDDNVWVFGAAEPANERLPLGDATGGSCALDESGVEETMENEVRVVPAEDGTGEQVVVMTTVFKKGRGDEEFFEDDCEVLDWAEDRV
jgi:hypothetical protein